LTIFSPNNLVIPGTYRDYRGREGILGLVTLLEQPVGMPGIMNPAFQCDEPGDNLLIGVDRDRSFQKVFSSLAGSG
jgi:hypothetical protein